MKDVEPIIQNMVATVNLQTRLDLRKIAMTARNAEYNPKRFAAAILRIRDPKTTALAFSSGKMVVTGAKSEQECKHAAHRYTRMLKAIGFNAVQKDFKIQNIVASVSLGFNVSLQGLSAEHVRFSQYEPELFPGLIYRMQNPKLVLLIFNSGKIVFTGAKTIEDVV